MKCSFCRGEKQLPGKDGQLVDCPRCGGSGDDMSALDVFSIVPGPVWRPWTQKTPIG